MLRFYNLAVTVGFEPTCHCLDDKHLSRVPISTSHPRHYNLAEAVRFELTDPFGSTVFKTVAINRTLPHFEINTAMQTYDALTKNGLLIHLSMTPQCDVCYIFAFDIYTQQFDMKYFTDMQSAREFIQTL
jgi:hypothetical protein